MAKPTIRMDLSAGDRAFIDSQEPCTASVPRVNQKALQKACAFRANSRHQLQVAAAKVNRANLSPWLALSGRHL